MYMLCLKVHIEFHEKFSSAFEAQVRMNKHLFWQCNCNHCMSANVPLFVTESVVHRFGHF